MKIYYRFLLLLLSNIALAQLTISNGNHVLEISGAASTFYNYRSLKDGELDQSKNRFRLRDAQLQFEGRIGHKWAYELQVDFADMAANAVEIDPENPGLMEAKVIYKGLDFMDIEVGYGKLNYSRSSLTPFVNSAYWQRASINRDLLSRRDIGITLKKSLMNQQLNLAFGAYTGLGENSLTGDNDASGALLYVGRVDFSYPSRFRYRDIDDKISPIPMFNIGVNARYSDRKLPNGETFPEFSQGEYGMKVINGEQQVFGFDAAFQYMGFSAQFEMHQMKGTPQIPTDALLQGLSFNQTGGYFKAGGWVAQGNYFLKNWNTIVSMRYEEMDFSDLVVGKAQRFSPAIAYQINGYNAMIKAQYFGNIKEDPLDAMKWNEQFRIGLQFLFK